jgi:hypothetical protein
VTTATHSLDTSCGATTVAELLARNGARSGQPSPPRSALEPNWADATLPAIPIVTSHQYRHDQKTVTALLTVQPAEPPAAPAERPRPETAKDSSRTGRKIAGLAFAGAVLVGGWAFASAQAPDHTGSSSAGPVPSKTPEWTGPAAALPAPVGTEVTPLPAAAPASTTQAQSPAPTQQQPDQGRFSGQLPTSSTTPAQKVPATPKVTPPPAQTATRLPNPPANYDWSNGLYHYDNAKPGGHQHDDNGHRPHR